MRLRPLSTLTDPADLAWFAPALEHVAALASDPDPRVRAFLSPHEPLWIARAPGRLDVMGGIADYSGATVLELPLAEATWVVLQRQAQRRLSVRSRRGDAWHAFDIELQALGSGALADTVALADWFAERPADRWAAYVVGVVQRALRGTPPSGDTAGGLRLLITSTVPEGMGVASSAALEVATMAAVTAALGIDIAPETLAAECQWVENHVCRAPCGIMDQLTSACGIADRLLRLSCQPGSIEGHVPIPHGYRLYGIASGVRHAVSGADYGTVRTAAFMGYRMIAEAAALPVRTEGARVVIDDAAWRGYLANIGPEEFAARFESQLPASLSGADFLARFGGITDTVTAVRPDRLYPVRQATAHPIREHDRVVRFARLLEELPDRPGAAVEAGRLMVESHQSYGACRLGSDGTDRLVALVAEAGPERGLFGAKITGGGSGGTVAVLGTDTAEPALRSLARRYAAETGRPVRVFSASGPGAAELGVVTTP